MGYYDEAPAKEEARQVALKELQELAIEQRLVLVKLSPRVTLIIKIGDSNGYGWRGTGQFAGYRTHLPGEIVFRGSNQECGDYLAGNGFEIPADLLKRLGT